MTAERRPQRTRQRRDGHQPPPFPPRAGRVDGAAGVRVAGRCTPAARRRKGPARLAATAAGAPLRSAFVYFPNGAIPASWWPSGEGTDFQFKQTLQPLEPLKGLVQVLGGLNHRTAEGGPDGAGDHARGNGTFLTGVRLKKSATDIRAGISIDQVIARRIGHLTRFPSLELACDSGRKSGACDSGYSCAYQFNLSWSSADDADAAGIQPAAGLRAPLRHRQARASAGRT